jgi:hypothetical protein
MRRWRGYQLPNGLPKKKKATPDRFDPDQLAIGIGVELEHTSRPEIAMEIAMAHLVERSDYYALLERMEKSPKRDASRHAYGGVRMCPCPGETRSPSMLTYDPEDPHFSRDRTSRPSRKSASQRRSRVRSRRRSG